MELSVASRSSVISRGSVTSDWLKRDTIARDDTDLTRRPRTPLWGPSNSMRNSNASQTIPTRPAPLPPITKPMKIRTFRLLDLPIELQRLVFFHYFGGEYDITLDYERITMLRTRFHIHGQPPINLLLVNKYINDHTAAMRKSLFSGRLVLNSVFILIPLQRQERFQWLRDHTRILHFTDSSVRPERWARYFESFKGLRRLEIDFPMVKKLEREGGLDLEDVMNGKEDDLLLSSLDEFRMALVEQLRDGRVEVVVKQRYSLCEASASSSGGCVVSTRYTLSSPRSRASAPLLTSPLGTMLTLLSPGRRHPP